MNKYTIRNTQYAILKPKTKNFLRASLLFVSLLYALRFTPCVAFAQRIPSSELISRAKDYDGKTVVFEGEVIGDIMKRGDYAWINVRDANNAIGIWISAKLTKDIAYTGSYKAKGDWIEVAGVFHRACAEHGGDLDLHALSLRKVSSGRPNAELVNTGKRNFAIVLLGILGIAWISRLSIRK